MRERMQTILVRCSLFFAMLVLYSCVEEQNAPISPVAPEQQPLTPQLSVQAAPDLWVYQDALQPPWLSASWSATVTYNSTEFVHAGSNSIKVVLTSAWGALSVHHGNWGSTGIDPSLYTGIEFAAYTATTGARLSIFFENDAGQTFPKVNYGILPAGQWTVITIPMSQLNPNGQTINRVDIQDISGGTPTFYVDGFRFVGSQSPGTPPSTPVLTSPANGATGVATNPTLNWSASSGASSYRVQISTTSSFSSTVRDQSNITGTSYSASGLSNSTTYYWRVNASNSDGTSDWSSIFSFTTTGAPQPPPAPTLTSPVNGATGVATNPTLNWSASSGASSYRVQISTASSFSTTVRDQSNITGTSYSASGLSNSTTYYWRVNASNSNGTSDWSTVFSFTTAAAPPPPSSAPDLTVDASRIRSTLQVRWRSFSSSSCAVVEGCSSPGYRKLLRFEVTVPNFGNADLVFGRPSDHPELFEYSPCHGHYHFKQFAEYRLLNASDQRIVAGRKQAFCLLDVRQYWSGYPSRGYDCDYQGISVGWGDVYGRSLDCQWLDITGIPSGDYIIEVEVNIGGFINEGANTHPNIVRVPVRIQ